MTVDVIFQGLTQAGTLEYHTESYQYPAEDIGRLGNWLDDLDTSKVIADNNWKRVEDLAIKRIK